MSNLLPPRLAGLPEPETKTGPERVPFRSADPGIMTKMTRRASLRVDPHPNEAGTKVQADTILGSL